jgi:hypothetical protein
MPPQGNLLEAFENSSHGVVEEVEAIDDEGSCFLLRLIAVQNGNLRNNQTQLYDRV